MKTSGKLIFILIGFFAAVIVISAILVRTSINKVVTMTRNGTETSDVDKTRIEKDFDMSGFSSVEMRGVWVADIIQGKEYSVHVSAPAYLFREIDVREMGKTLNMEMDKLTMIGFSNNDIRASITCPSLESITAEGASSITIKNFDSPALTVRIDGAVTMEGSENKIGELALAANGAVNVDFRDSLTENASIRMDGASSVKITMNGGVLDGEINGLGSVEYYGDVRAENIRKNGLSSVKRK